MTFEEYWNTLVSRDCTLSFIYRARELAKTVWQDAYSWTYTKDKKPDNEFEVLVLTDKGTVTTAIYENGKIRVDDSIWIWYDNDVPFEKDEQGNELVPEGWWEYRHFNDDDLTNNCIESGDIIEEHVIAWMTLPERTQNESNSKQKA